MAFASDAPHHQRARSHQAWPHAANGVDKRAKPRAHSDQKILIEQEEGLDRTNLANRILYDEIAVIELRVQRILNQLVISMILTFVRECNLPARTLSQIVTLDDFET